MRSSHLESGGRPSLVQNQGVRVSKINLKLYRMVGESSGIAFSKAETSASRLHVLRMPEWMEKLISIFAERRVIVVADENYDMWN